MAVCAACPGLALKVSHLVDTVYFPALQRFFSGKRSLAVLLLSARKSAALFQVIQNSRKFQLQLSNLELHRVFVKDSLHGVA
jgi:hypothetical protein